MSLIDGDGATGKTKYWFVLHYIPDMHWCHLAPLRQDGVFPATLKNGNPSAHAGRPRWKLVPEGEGKELDVSAERCKIIKSATVHKTQDADKEAWDVLWEEQEELDKEEAKKIKVVDSNSKVNKALFGASKGNSKAGAVVLPPSPPARIPASVWREECLKICIKLMRQDKAWPFCDPVDPVALNLPDYFDIIKVPMDLGTVRKKLEAGGYEKASSCVDDLETTFNNAIAYNPSTDAVHTWAVALSSLLNKLVDKSEKLRQAIAEEKVDPKSRAQTQKALVNISKSS